MWSLDDYRQDRLEQSTLFRMTEAAGFKLWFLPKFHSELSAIERCWAVVKFYVRRYHEYTLESLRACVLLAVKDFCGADVIRRAYNTTFRFLYLYHVTKATTAEAKAAEAARAPAAKVLRRAMAMPTGAQAARCKLMLCMARYQDVMIKEYCSHRRPARGLEELSEEGIPDSLLWQYRSMSFDDAVAGALCGRQSGRAGEPER